MRQPFPSAPERPLPDEDPGSVARPIAAAPACCCASCEEARACDIELLKRGPEQVTIVRTYKDPRSASPTSTKAFVSCRDGRIGAGAGHSDILAIIDAIRNVGAC